MLHLWRAFLWPHSTSFFSSALPAAAQWALGKTASAPVLPEHNLRLWGWNGYKKVSGSENLSQLKYFLIFFWSFDLIDPKKEVLCTKNELQDQKLKVQASWPLHNILNMTVELTKSFLNDCSLATLPCGRCEPLAKRVNSRPLPRPTVPSLRHYGSAIVQNLALYWVKKQTLAAPHLSLQFPQ